MDPAYLRPVGDSARLEYFSGDAGSLLSGEYPGLLHGDLIWRGGRQATGTYVLAEGGAEPIADEHGRGVIPRRVSARIGDPVRFYQYALGEPCGLREIEMAPDAHQGPLSRAAGGRPVDGSRHVVWRREDGPGYWIRSPRSPDIPGGYTWVLLDPETPATYLARTEFLVTDPTMEARRRDNARRHGAQSERYLLGLAAGAVLNVRNAPDMDPGYVVSWMTFDSVAKDSAGRVAEVRATNHSGQAVIFQRRCWGAQGPYGSVAVWSSEGDPAPLRAPEGRTAWMLHL